MSLTVDPVLRNLLIYLDPAGGCNGADWRFIVWRRFWKEFSQLVAERKNPVKTVYCFDRRHIAGYLLFSLFANKFCAPFGGRKVLYLNDGLLSSIFDAERAVGYRVFAANHLPAPARLRQKLASIFPLFMRAEKRYVIVGLTSDTHHSSQEHSELTISMQDFMFFSNAAGKLLLTSAETLRSGTGLMFKTTASPDYLNVMDKEFSIMRDIAEMQGQPTSLPQVGGRIQFSTRTYFTETYVKGASLRDEVHRLSRRNDISELRASLDRLDDWYENYRAFFKADFCPLSSCYEHVFVAFSEQSGQHPLAAVAVKNSRNTLAMTDDKHVAVIPVTAHNDLWPGNFIVGPQGLMAIDWERAAANRAPLFDYYWMLISAALEYHVACIGSVDYSIAFRLFLKGSDAVTYHATEKMQSFLERLGLDKELHQDFLLMFLMEWSVQGYLALGRTTAMDRLAFGELIDFLETNYC